MFGLCIFLSILSGVIFLLFFLFLQEGTISHLPSGLVIGIKPECLVFSVTTTKNRVDSVFKVGAMCPYHGLDQVSLHYLLLLSLFVFRGSFNQLQHIWWIHIKHTYYLTIP